MTFDVHRNERQVAQAHKGTGRREPKAQADVHQIGVGPSNGEGDYRKKALKSCRNRSIAKELVHYGISRACRVLNMSKRVYYYKPLPKDDTEIEQALQHKAKELSEEGFWKVYERLRSEGKPWNHKRVHRIY